MTKVPKSMDNNQHESDDSGMSSANNSRKNNYKVQKPILEKRRRDRINGSLDELKTLLLAIKQRDPLRYARLEKADILEMVVKYLKDLKKRRQAMIAAMEPVLFRSFKMGFLDCTRTTIDFINEIATPAERKQQLIDHITGECMKTLQNQCPPVSFNQHHEIVFSNVNPPEHFIAFPPLLTTASELEWPSLEEKLGFSPISKASFILPDLPGVKDLPTPSSSSSLLKIAEQPPGKSLESPSTSGSLSEMPHQHDISDDEEDDEDVKLIIDDHNNNQAAWRPWL